MNSIFLFILLTLAHVTGVRMPASWYFKKLNPEDVIFKFFTSKNESKDTAILDDGIAKLIDPTKQTRIFIHGWHSYPNQSKDLAEAYIKAYVKVNFIFVDWTRGLHEDYYLAATNVDIVGKQVANLLKFLIENFPQKTFLERLETVAHSMAAHALAIGEYYIFSGNSNNFFLFLLY